MTSPTISLATLPVVRALLDEALGKHYTAGTLGVRARPEWLGPDAFDHHGVPVQVVPCVSTLAVREALSRRADDCWLVILTDREDGDLGAGVRSHLVWHRLRTPDPWNAVLGKFAATGLDSALTHGPGLREMASGLLACEPVGGSWPPAPGGVLTRGHALSSVAQRYLQLTAELDPKAVLMWTAEPRTAGLVAELRRLAGDALASAVLDWTTGHAGSIGPALSQLLRKGQSREAVPVGLVLGPLLAARSGSDADAEVVAREALVRLEPRTSGTATRPVALDLWAKAAGGVVEHLLRVGRSPDRLLAERLLVEADALLTAVQAETLAENSPLLPTSLYVRLARLATELRTAVSSSEAIDRPAVTPSNVRRVEAAWQSVSQHLLAARDSRVEAFHAAVRLTRWLALDTTAGPTDLPALHRRQLTVDAWVDSAVNDIAPGVGDAELGAALSHVLAEVRRRRDRHDEEFAEAVAQSTREDQPSDPAASNLEDVLVRLVLPVVRTAPVLLLVLDGMSAAVGSEVIADVLDKVSDGWAEVLPAGRSQRLGALAVLPSITEVSRASLLSGELVRGGQDAEQRGYATLVRDHGLAGSRLFHKKPLDSSQLGFAVAAEVGSAIDDKLAAPLVTCVLNTIDDALDRSDPAGTVWTAEAVKHLRPLLDRARLAGRVVILTSDHGHIVERRQGMQRSHPVISSGRSRAEGPVGPGEVLVVGPRVLLHDGRAVLAVDERLRYGPLKAGYHGGASPAEVVVPVYFLVSGGAVGDTGLVPAGPQEPAWWLDPAVVSLAPVELSALPQPTSARPDSPTLFDAPGPVATTVPEPASQLGALVIASSTYADQRRMAGRVSLLDGQVRRLLDALLAAPAHRLPQTLAASALGVAPLAMRGALPQAQRLLNIEGYPVLDLDVDGSTVVLDEALLREQFEVSR